jgi:hypothetical protein
MGASDPACGMTRLAKVCAIAIVTSDAAARNLSCAICALEDAMYMCG